MISTNTAMDSLFVRCKRPDLGTNAAVLTVYPDRLEVSYGNPSYLGGVTPVQRESLRFVDYPELRNVRDICGWNLAEVMAIISY